MKKTYFQPELTIVSIALQSDLITSSETPLSDPYMEIYTYDTDDQW